VSVKAVDPKNGHPADINFSSPSLTLTGHSSFRIVKNPLMESRIETESFHAAERPVVKYQNNEIIK